MRKAKNFIPGCEVQAVEELGNGIAGRLTNLGLLHECLVEERHGILLLLAAAGIATGILAIDLLLRHRAGDVESHLDELVLACCCLLA